MWAGIRKGTVMHTTTRDRIGAATGATFVTCIFVGNVMATSGQSTSMHPTGTEVLRDAAHAAASTTATIGLLLEVCGFGLFIVFLGFLADLLRPRAPGSWTGLAAGTAVVAGIVELAIKLGSAAPFLTLALDRDQMDPEIARVLNDINGMAFLVSWLPLSVFLGGLAVALRGAGLVGRPTMYVGLVSGVAGFAMALWGVQDPMSANPIALMVGMLWLLVVTVRLTVKPGRTTETTDLAAERIPAAV
jgi:hypothetical protein